MTVYIVSNQTADGNLHKPRKIFSEGPGNAGLVPYLEHSSLLLPTSVLE